MVRTNIKELKELKGVTLGNNVVSSLELNIVAHFGNEISFKIICRNIIPYSGYNNNSNLSDIIKDLFEVLDLSCEDGIWLSKISNVPCRLIFNEDEAIGIANFMTDKYVLFNDWI